MKIHEFGEYNRGTIVMIHGECMPWDMFKGAIDILAGRFHVYAAALPGHDPSMKEEFTSVEDVAARIEATLLRDGAQHIDLLYGLSMGGALVMRILSDNGLDIDRVVIDAGTAPRENAGLLAKLFSPENPIKRGIYSRSALAGVFPPQRFDPALIDKMYALMQQMSYKSVQHVLDAANSYSMPEKLADSSVQAEYWYGALEESRLRSDIAFVRGFMPDVKLRRIEGMAHAQYVLSCPEQFAADISRRMW